ncbi:MAG: DUF5677 domain-containing protein, partial [Candidatus Acidiferrales bacterium]
LPDSQLVRLERTRRLLLKRYGNRFDEPYGWANEALRGNGVKVGKRISFRDIEEAVGLSHWRPYYRLASHSIHPTATFARFNIGVLGEQTRLLPGPSNYGLADPGHGALLSLGQLTTALLGYKPDLNLISQLPVMVFLTEYAGDAFLRVQRQIESEEAAKNRVGEPK